MKKMTIHQIDEDGATIESGESVPLNGETSCSICLDRYAAGDVVAVTPCNHVFHDKCMDSAFQTTFGACPICRAPCIGPGPSSRVSAGLFLRMLSVLIGMFALLSFLMEFMIMPMTLSVLLGLSSVIPNLPAVLSDAIDPQENLDTYIFCIAVVIISLPQYLFPSSAQHRQMAGGFLLGASLYALLYRLMAVWTKHSLFYERVCSSEPQFLVEIVPFTIPKVAVSEYFHSVCHPFAIAYIIHMVLAICIAILLFLYGLNKLCRAGAVVITDYLMALYFTLYGTTPAPPEDGPLEVGVDELQHVHRD